MATTARIEKIWGSRGTVPGTPRIQPFRTLRGNFFDRINRIYRKGKQFLDSASLTRIAVFREHGTPGRTEKAEFDAIVFRTFRLSVCSVVKRNWGIKCVIPRILHRRNHFVIPNGAGNFPFMSDFVLFSCAEVVWQTGKQASPYTFSLLSPMI